MQPDSSNFPLTHWSLVEVVRGDDEGKSLRALEDLCHLYWYPIYAYLRRSGHPPPDAEDLTQGFFHRLISEDALQGASQELGRLRSYLLGVLKRFLSDVKRHQTALKRGGGTPTISFDDVAAEDRYQMEPKDLATPDKLFDHAWARGLLQDASLKLRATFEEGDNSEAYHHLSEYLPLGANARSYREVASSMGVNESVVRLQVHRMRKRYRGLIEEEIALTVRDSSQVNDELDYLMAAIGG